MKQQQTVAAATLHLTFVIVVVAFAVPTTAGEVAMAKYGQPFEGKIARSYHESEEWWPTTPKPPPGTLNVILFLLDETGFGHVGSFGGLIDTPNIDRLAEGGLRYNNFFAYTGELDKVVVRLTD